MLEDPVSSRPQVGDARWSSSLTGNSAIAAIVWVLLLIVLFVSGLPFTLAMFGSFADRGVGFARLTSLLLAGFLVWFAASHQLILFRAAWSAVAVVLVYAIGLALLRSVHPHQATLKLGKRDLRRMVWSELSFWGVFALFLLYRLINPDSWHPIWGGEKPMEFAHINAILRSGEFPPYDPWYSGGVLNYYYYGEYLVAFLFKLTGIPSEIAFNLAQPTIMGLLASGAFSVSATIGAHIDGKLNRAPLFGFAGVLLTVGIGNLSGFERIVEAFPNWPSVDFNNITWAGSRAIDGGITEFPYFTGLYADLHAHVVALPITVFAIGLCYAIVANHDGGDRSIGSERRPTSRVLLATRLLALALALGSLSAANAWDVPVYALLAAAALWMAFGQRASSFPRRLIWTAAGIAVTGAAAYLAFKPFHDRFEALYSSIDWVPAGTAIEDFLIHLGGLSLVLCFGMPFLIAGRRAEPERRIERTVTLIGVTLLMVVATLSIAWQDHAADGYDVAAAAAVALLTGMLGIALSAASRDKIVGWIVPGWIAIAIATAGIGWATLGVALFLAAAGSLVWLYGRGSAARYVGLLVLAGFGVAAGVERVFLVDDLASLPDWFRMNTVFKLYNQVWILLALAAAGALAALVEQAFTSSMRSAGSPPASSDSSIPAKDPASMAPQSDEPARRDLGNALAWVGLSASIAVIVASLLYPVLATRPRLELRFAGHPSLSTLNALDWMTYGSIQLSDGSIVEFDEDKEVIDWFNDQIDGTPVIAEASIGPYRGNGSRISIATGLPSVLGWDRHERQQRSEPGISQRYQDLRALYSTPDPALKEAIIDRYGIDYIVVGQLERDALVNDGLATKYASEQGLAAFEAMLGDSLEIAFRSGYTVVYRVL